MNNKIFNPACQHNFRFSLIDYNMENIRQRYVSRYAAKEKEPSKIKGILTKQLLGAIIVAAILMLVMQLNNELGITVRRKIADTLAYNLNYEIYWSAICNFFAR